MKIAISGKGGVGKTTLAAVLAGLLAEKGHKILAVDADPDANLATALGISPTEQAKIIPIAKQKELIEERTGAKVGQYGQMFKINPEVSDIAKTYGYDHNGVSLIVLGAIQQGGGGCACPESILLRALIQDMILHKDEDLVMDMEAGIEHLGRATARGVDKLIVVAEPGRRSVESVERIIRLAREIGMHEPGIVINKVATPDEQAFAEQALASYPLLGTIPYHNIFRDSDRLGKSVFDSLDDELRSTFEQILHFTRSN